MAIFVGTEGPDTFFAPFNTNANVFYGLGGDDTLTGSLGQDRFYAGPGKDRLSGSHGTDYYYYILSFESIYIDEYESSTANGPTNNYNDRLVLFTKASVNHPEGTIENDDFGLEFVQDAFFVMPGQTAESPFGDSFIETDVLIYTDTGVIHIYDQYGGVVTPDNNQHTDGIEWIDYRWTNFFGSTFERAFRISSETDVFTGTQIGSAAREFFFGTRGPDTIFGNAGDDMIFTGAGDDTVFGGTGVDHIVASAGTNLLDGGDSGDIYYWNAAYTARNIVREFAGSDDDELVASFDVADLGRAFLSGGTALTLNLQYRNLALPNQVLSSFEIERQIDTQTTFRGIEYLRFAGKYFVAQNDFSADGVGTPTANHNANDFIVATPGFSGRMRGFDGDDAIFGGSGPDRIFGGAGDDLLVGGGGDDTLFGGAGDDILRGGPGADVLNGGPGSNSADYRFSAQGVFVNLTNGRAEGGQAEGDVLRNIQNLIGGAGDDTLIGDGGPNTLTGGHGDDVLRGRAGRDELRGGPGDDRIYGDNGADVIWGGAGADRMWGGKGGDKIYGGPGADRAWGGGGSDEIWGGGGADRLWGGAGPDRVWGGNGDDLIFGGGGDDRIWGNQGNDVIVGGPGNDIMWGGGGRDTFVFGRNSGDDQVRDFTPGRDKLDMSRVASGFADLTLTDTDDGLLIGHAGGSVRLRGVSESDLRLQDVEF